MERTPFWRAFRWGPWLAAAVVFAALQAAARWPGLAPALSHPAAWVAAQVSGARLDVDGEGVLCIAHSVHGLRVVERCAGRSFLSLLGAVLGWSLARRRAPWALWLCLPPAAYGLTVLANAMRLVAALHAHAILDPLLPVGMHAALHQFMGMLAYLPVLIAAHLLCERIPRHEHACL